MVGEFGETDWLAGVLDRPMWAISKTGRTSSYPIISALSNIHLEEGEPDV